MAKRERKSRKQHPREARPKLTLAEMDLEEARRLRLEGRAVEALRILLILDERNPDWLELLLEVSNCYAILGDWEGLAEVSERLLRHLPEHPQIAFNLAEAHGRLSRDALALDAFRLFVEQWAEHERADDAREKIELLERGVDKRGEEWGLPRETAVQVMRDHELAAQWTARGEDALAREAAERVLAVFEHVPTLNNLCQLQWEAGDGEDAVASTRRVLAKEPENVHAQANLVRFLFLAGHEDEARAEADRLKSMPFDRPDAWLKKAEVFSFLGDDPAVLEVFQDAEKDPRAVAGRSIVLHMAAAATCHLGQEAEAIALWERALELMPVLSPAMANLVDLRHPLGERHGPWVNSVDSWLPESLQEEIKSLAAETRGSSDRNDAERWRRWLQKRPHVLRLLPHLLARGDEACLALALLVATMTRIPETDRALVDFLLGQRGPDQLRLQAAPTARGRDLIPKRVRLWLKGEWRDIAVGGFQLTNEPMGEHAPEVAERLKRAVGCLGAGDFVGAERLLLEALELEPGAPDLRQNLAGALHGQGRAAEARALVLRLNEEHPTYVLAAANLAFQAAEGGDLERARDLLHPLDELEKMHVTEFSALAKSHCVLHAKELDMEQLETWLDMWHKCLPDDPELHRWLTAFDHAKKTVKRRR